MSPETIEEIAGWGFFILFFIGAILYVLKLHNEDFGKPKKKKPTKRF